MSFNPGQDVTVRHIDSGMEQKPFDGTVVSYWRNGLWIVREPTYGTTCAYPEGEITAR